jgi:isopenicillin-N epimerase
MMLRGRERLTLSLNESSSAVEAEKQPDWDAVRTQFDLDRDYIHMAASQFIVSHPKPVREAIDRHRRGLDRNPVRYVLDNEDTCSLEICRAAARYLDMDRQKDIALTDSTTMGLGIVYAGLCLRKGQEIVSSERNYYSHQEAIRLAAQRAGADHREVALYPDIRSVSEDDMVDSLLGKVSDRTRVLSVTWVHSSTGLKAPVAKIARALAEVNRNRDEPDRVLLIVDGVHGFGLEQETMPELGCDFLITGCHKWLYGPRGTGLVAATRDAWQTVTPVIPSFTAVMQDYIHVSDPPKHMDGAQMTPGGFHSLEHRWALLEAFRFVESIGKAHIWRRVHELCRRLKEGLADMPHVTLVTPLEDHLSAGIVSFDVRGFKPPDVTKRLLDRGIIATTAPYRESHVRFTPGIYNTVEEVDRVLDAVQKLS